MAEGFIIFLLALGGLVIYSICQSGEKAGGAGWGLVFISVAALLLVGVLCLPIIIAIATVTSPLLIPAIILFILWKLFCCFRKPVHKN